LSSLIKYLTFFQSNITFSRWFNGNKAPLEEEVTYLPWAFDQPNGQASQKCISYDFERVGYNDEECSTRLCIPCRMLINNFFRIRGFPEELTPEKVDVDYFLLMESSKVSFEGFSGSSSIINNSKENVWQLLSNGNVIGHNNGTNSIPVGLCEWYFHNLTTSKINLKMTQVLDFTY
jgi:hypothetical protein